MTSQSTVDQRRVLDWLLQQTEPRRTQTIERDLGIARGRIEAALRLLRADGKATTDSRGHWSATR